MIILQGRQCAGIILDNWCQGRSKAIWISKSSALIEDARRDWCALGGSEKDIIDLGNIKLGDPIPLSQGVLFATDSTLRSQKGGKSRLKQIIEWAGIEFLGAIANIAETNAFMQGDKQILIFSDAGGTGRSYHADLNAVNRRRRSHYLLEADWRADNAIQGLGRSHRTNQASTPVFRPVTTNVRGERRFISTIARRLDSLGALTRGQRQTGGNGIFDTKDNLESNGTKKRENR